MMTTAAVPESVAAAVEGCWNLGENYRITLSRSDSSLHCDQEASTPVGKRVVQHEPVRYNPEDGTLGFTGIGAIHRTLVVLRLSGNELEFAFSTEVSPGKWTQGGWEKARRCPAERPK